MCMKAPSLVVFLDWLPAVQHSQSIATLHLRDPIGYVCSDTFLFIPARAFGAWQESSRMTYTLIRLPSYSSSCILLFYRSKGTEHLINLSQTHGSLYFLLPPSCQYLFGFLHLNLSRRGQGYCVKKPPPLTPTTCVIDLLLPR
jgi:hypothetical protein